MLLILFHHLKFINHFLRSLHVFHPQPLIMGFVKALPAYEILCEQPSGMPDISDVFCEDMFNIILVIFIRIAFIMHCLQWCWNMVERITACRGRLKECNIYHIIYIPMGQQLETVY